MYISEYMHTHIRAYTHIIHTLISTYVPLRSSCFKESTLYIIFITNLKSCCSPPSLVPLTHKGSPFFKGLSPSSPGGQLHLLHQRQPLSCSLLGKAWTSDFPASSGPDVFPFAGLLACDFLSFPFLSGRLSLSCKDWLQMSSSLSSLFRPALYPGGTISCFLLWGFTTLPTKVYQCLIWHYIVIAVMSCSFNTCECVHVCVCLCVFICLAHSRYKCLLRWC